MISFLEKQELLEKWLFKINAYSEYNFSLLSYSNQVSLLEEFYEILDFKNFTELDYVIEKKNLRHNSNILLKDYKDLFVTTENLVRLFESIPNTQNIEDKIRTDFIEILILNGWQYEKYETPILSKSVDIPSFDRFFLMIVLNEPSMSEIVNSPAIKPLPQDCDWHMEVWGTKDYLIQSEFLRDEKAMLKMVNIYEDKYINELMEKERNKEIPF